MVVYTARAPLPWGSLRPSSTSPRGPSAAREQALLSGACFPMSPTGTRVWVLLHISWGAERWPASPHLTGPSLERGSGSPYGVVPQWLRGLRTSQMKRFAWSRLRGGCVSRGTWSADLRDDSPIPAQQDLPDPQSQRKVSKRQDVCGAPRQDFLCTQHISSDPHSPDRQHQGQSPPKSLC